LRPGCRRPLLLLKASYGPVALQAGHISRVEAMRRLLREALKDPLNDRWALPSSSGMRMPPALSINTTHAHLRVLPTARVPLCSQQRLLLPLCEAQAGAAPVAV